MIKYLIILIVSIGGILINCRSSEPSDKELSIDNQCISQLVSLINPHDEKLRFLVNNEVKYYNDNEVEFKVVEILIHQDTSEYILKYFREEGILIGGSRVPSSVIFIGRKAIGIGYGRSILFFADNPDLCRFIIQASVNISKWHCLYKITNCQ